MNPYLYGRGNPANTTDPSGKFWQFVVSAAIGAVIGAGVGAGGAIWVEHRDAGDVLKEAGIGAGVGAVVGAASAYNLPMGAILGIGVSAGAISNIGNQ